MRSTSRRWIAATLAALAAFVPSLGAAAADTDVAFAPVACPASVGVQVDCLEGQDVHGAWLLVAMPRRWNRTLIVHAHGGPRLGEPKAGDSAEDLDRFAVMVREGHAWIGTTYRRGGYGVRMAAADVEHSRRVFWSRWGRPERTLLHGQSWGGNVAAKAAELYALDIDGRPNFDGVLTTNGLLFGGTRAYGFRADLRAVYQYYCRNHPAVGEAQYPLWQGLPAGAKMTRDDLRKRVDDCTGVDQPASKRTPAQAANLRDILAVTGVAEQQLVAHLAWGTFHFQDMVQKRLGGRNPFDNRTTVYRGSRDDTGLNAGVERFAADPAAVARLAYDADLSGLIVLPTVTVHARHDPTVSYDADAAYRATVAAAGRGHLLLQALTDERDHSRLQDATYATALQVLERWLDTGTRPPATTFAETCARASRTRAACRFIAP